MDSVKIGKIISRRRKQLKITKKELAKRLDIEVECITHWEKGKCLPFFELLPKLSKELNLSLYELLGDGADVINNTMTKKSYLLVVLSMLTVITYKTPIFILSLTVYFVIGLTILFKELKKLYN